MKVNELVEVTGATKFGSKQNFVINHIRIDSRMIEKNDCYIALLGKKLDGHEYIDAAIKKGAKIILCSTLPEKLNKWVVYLLVEDTNLALLNLGKYMRMLHPVPLIAITGSVGKTTTKELLYQVLKTKYRVLKSPGNYNNRIGVPLTLLEQHPLDQFIIMEMGMNHIGEIKELSNICKPDIGIITNIGTSHIGFLEGKKNIYKAKIELLDGMDNGFVIVSNHDSYLKKLSSTQLEVIKVGKKDTIYFSHVKLYAHMTYAWLHVNGNIYPISFKIPGNKILDIILLVVEAGLLLQIPIEDIITAIEQYQGTKERLEWICLKNGVTLIDDSYNASLESLENDLSIMNVIEGKKVLIFGDILELGSYSKKIHKEAIKKIKKVKNLEVLLVGSNLGKVKGKLKCAKWFSDVQNLNQYLEGRTFENETILVKGSHGIHLNEAVMQIKKSHI